MVESECRECVRVCTHRRWTAEGECVEHVHVCAPTGDGRPKVSECVECVCVHPHVCSPQLRAWVRVCLVPVDTGGGVCVCVCMCMYVCV